MPVLAQDIQVRLADAGIAEHSLHGTGIEMQFEIRGARVRDVPDEFLKALCDQFSPEVVPLILEQNPQLEADFIGVRLKSGGIIGSFVFEAFGFEDSGCGAAK
ncbi:hypothetical protein SAMN05444287_2234 [Octadecabacter temperatus]|uniref:Uncharacterized protein n=2 Tax=Octadecabacter temperatus TaxID=1458307 RepID=A0A0K0Y1P4_9RHOB|nr:hypothetical protein OSB_02820 [Octadecabacter temperatus]SIO34535.1 hypothetical protein SAMN05444287_2234 [Octadecabacter temperatus]